MRPVESEKDEKDDTYAHEQKRRWRRMEAPHTEPDSKCIGFFCKYGTSQGVNANSTNVTEWLDTSTTTPHHHKHKDKSTNISNNNAPGKHSFGTSNGNTKSKNSPNPDTDGTIVPMLILGCLNIGRDILLHPRCSAKASVLTHVAEIVEMHP